MEHNTATLMNSLPDYLLEYYILPYLTSFDIFNLIRCVSVDYYNAAKSTLQVNFNCEMMSHLNKIMEMNKDKELTIQFEFENQRIINEKSVLLVCSLQIHQSLSIQNIVDRINDDNDSIKRLLILLFKLTNDRIMIEMINDPNMFQPLKQFMLINDNWFNFRNQLNNLLDNDFILQDYQVFLDEFNTLDGEYIMNVSENAINVYVFLRKLIEHQQSKIQLMELKAKVDIFLNKITETSNQWPRQKNFFEKTMLLLKESTTSDRIVRKMLQMFDRYKVDSLLADYTEDKEAITVKSPFKLLLKNRALLMNLMERIKKMYPIVSESLDNRTGLCRIDKEDIDLGHFLYYITLIKPEIEINNKSILHIRILLKKHAKLNQKELLLNTSAANNNSNENNK